MSLVMEEEVRHLAGEWHQQQEGRRAHRWGREDGYCVIGGQKVPIQKTRLRTKDKREQRLGSYELVQRSGSLQQGVWDKMMRGLSTRNSYCEAVSKICLNRFFWSGVSTARMRCLPNSATSSRSSSMFW